MSSRPPPLPPPSPPSRHPGGSAPPPPSASRPKPTAARPPAARYAAYALLAFTAITALTLVAYFLRADQPWGFESFIALLSALLGSGATVLLWRSPTREHALGGLAVLGLSILRVGLPTEWGTAAAVVLTVTALLAIPLVQAAIVLPRS